MTKRLEGQTRAFDRLAAPERGVGRRRWLALGLAWCAQASGAAVFLGVAAIAPQFARRYGMGLRALGITFAALMLGAGLSVVPWGALADRVGERRVIVVGLALAALALVLAAAVPARTIVLACLLVAGVGGASASAASSRAVISWFGSSERGFAMGIRQTALPIGAAAAALGLPRLVSAWSVSVAIGALGVACGLTAVAVAAGMGDRSLSGGRPTPKQRRWLAPLSEPRLRRVVAASALLAAPQLGLASFVVVFLHDRRGWSVTDAAALLAAVQVAGAAVRPAVGRWSDRHRDRTGPMFVAALIAAMTLLVLGVLSAGGGLPLVAIVVAAGIATLSWNGLAALAAGEFARSDGIGLALGWQTSAVFIGGTIGGPAFTAVVSMTSWSVGFAALAVPALVAAVIVRPATGRHRRSESELLGRALASMSASICLIDMRDPSQPIVYINAAFERLTGYPAAEVIGRNWKLSEGPETDPQTAAALHEAAARGEELRVSVRQHRRDGTVYWSETLMAPVYDEDGTVTHYMSVQKDITEKTEAVERASHMAYHDPLTGLPNRAQLQEHLALALTHAERDGHAVALLFFDLDRFKPVNDRYGHLAGDRLLEDVARRWRSIARNGEVLARLGGDEFVLLLTDLAPETARQSAAIAAARCAETLKLPFDVRGTSGQVIEIGVSVGFALYPQEAMTPTELLLAADAAMYAAKRDRRGSDRSNRNSAPQR